MMLSYSHLRSLQSCERKWWFRYPEGWRLKEEREGSSAMHVGRMFHALLECYYADPDFNPQGYFNSMFLVHEDDPDEIKKLNKVNDMWNAYLREYGSERDTIGVTSTEVELSVANGSRVFGPAFPVPYGMIGYADAIAANADGVPYIVEHKTTTRTYATWLNDEIPALRLQTGIYALLYAHLNNCAPPAVLFNVVRQHVGPRAEQPHAWRHWLVFSESMQAAIRFTVSQMAHRVALAYERARFEVPPPTHGMQCSSCDFAAVCPSFDEDSNVDDLMKEFYVRTEFK